MNKGGDSTFFYNPQCITRVEGKIPKSSSSRFMNILEDEDNLILFL